MVLFIIIVAGILTARILEWFLVTLSRWVLYKYNYRHIKKNVE